MATRREFLGTLGLGAAGLVVLPGMQAVSKPERAAPGGRPNVILVMTDDQGYGDVGALGNKIIKTPHLDKLHAQSTRLTDFHVAPCCTPTRAQLMFAQDAVRTGAWGTTWGRSLPRRDLVSMADVFAAGGYATGHFGKWHLGDNYPYRPGDRGFGEVLRHGGGGVGQGPDHWGNDYFDDTYCHNGTWRKYKGYCTDVWFDGAMRFIEDSARKVKPFFCYVPTNAPHGPYNVAARYSSLYAGKKVPNANFYGMITNIDENMGRLDKRLRELGLVENTILIFMTDNGTSAGVGKKGTGGFNAGMRGKKGSFYEGGHRVPCFIRWPGGGLTGPRDVEALTCCQDLLPTLMNLCGLATPEKARFDGTDLAALLLGKAAALPERILVVQYSQTNTPPPKWRSAVMSAHWRLVAGKELYNIKADPGQKRNLAARHPDVVRKLRNHYEKWWAGVEGRFNDLSHIVIGSDRDNPTCLMSFDWHTKRAVWSQREVLQGSASNSFWAVEVERDGEYEFALRRWPEVVNKPITAAIKGGKAIRATKARIKIADADETKPVGRSDTAAVFRLKLQAGKTKLQTWFIDEKGANRGAYYVYVKRLG